MVLTVVALCAIPSFASGSDSTRLYLYPYLFTQSYNNESFSALGSSNKMTIFADDSDTVYHVGCVYRTYLYNDNTGNYYYKYPYTYNGTWNFRIAPTSATVVTPSITSVKVNVILGFQNNFTNASIKYPFNFNYNSQLRLLNVEYYSQFSYTTTLNISPPYVIEINPVFRFANPLPDSELSFIYFVFSFYSSTHTEYDVYITNYAYNVTYDLTGDSYNQAVLNQVNQIQNDIDNLGDSIDSFAQQNHLDSQGIQNQISSSASQINNNLDSIDTSVQGVGQKVEDMSDAIQNKLDELAQQEEKKTQDSADDATKAGDALTDGIDLSFTKSLNLLYQSLSYSGTSFNFQLPASGTIPFLNSQLWSTQNIPFKQYLDYVPQPVFVVLRLLLGLGFGLCLVSEIRSIISMINGERGE